MTLRSELFLTCAVVLAGSNLALANEAPLNQISIAEPGAAGASTIAIEPEDAPLQIIVSRKDQTLRVFRGQEVIATSRVSTGKAGHSTPTGVFSILEKRRTHFSNLYNSAPMPYMQRLTWSGVALHESNSVPNYPASHGCVRLPAAFAKELFSLTERGAHVIIASREVEPMRIESGNLFQPELTDLANKISSLSLGPVKPLRAHGKISLLSDRPTGDPIAEQVALRLNMLDQVKQSDAPIRIFITRQPKGNLVRDIQVKLNQLGFDAGEPDGLAGSATYGAIRAFLDAKKGSIESRTMSMKAVINKQLLASLYTAAGEGEVPTGHIYVRSNFKPLFDAPITIKDPSRPLGAHLLTANRSLEQAGKLDWLSVNLYDRYSASLNEQLGLQFDPEKDALVDTGEVLDRLVIPDEIRAQINHLVKSGSSITISDRGMSRETTDVGTDFIVLTKTRMPSKAAVSSASRVVKKKPVKVATSTSTSDKPKRKTIFSLIRRSSEE
ncbi:L,D-transpeptidase family protein [uncultured Cohaesibacter sp.]|uniref:L,D-transpeptidase family protein n=1 Tax=uncultured Cohaesibacter sp. TaxID=1002546 RepID=UPI00292F762F|nr:L,D-transpeptidase family protein [uncultured Cohaesibacter sp.]